MNSTLDQATLSFSPESLVVLNFALGFLMFAVSLFIEPRDFRSIRERPRGLMVGLAMQWFLLPLLTVALIWIIKPHPGLALGMLLVAACPGGNISNYMNLLARANVALSIGLTTISTLAAAFMTPLLFFVGAALATGEAALPKLDVNLGSMILLVLTVVAVPLALGQLLKRLAPRFTDRIRNPMRSAAGLVLIGFIVVALVNNLTAFRGDYLLQVAWVIVLGNALALGSAYLFGTLCGLAEADRRAVTIESGIHNSGLGLVLIFNFFNGSGPMALVAAGWGIWHLVTGGLLALWWSRSPPSLGETTMNDLTHGRLPVTLTTVDGEKNGLPLVVTPGTARNVAELVAWLRAEPAWHRQQLLNHGAILFRGFGVATPQEFESLARALDPELKNEYLGTSPRDALTEYVFSASELPDYYPIPEHCEMTFTAHPPRRIFFWCGVAPKSPGGETPIVDFARVWKELDPAVRERFETNGVRIVRNYSGPEDSRRDLFQLKRWDQMFRTTDKSKVETMARAEGFEPQWHEHDRLTLISRHKPVRAHPETGEPVWFNHAQVFHLSTAGAELKRIFRYRPSLRALGFWIFAAALVSWKRLSVSPEAQAMHCTYDNGTEILPSDMEHLRDVIWNNLVVYAWKQGDVAAIDNNRVGHGRLPYRGKRMVAVCWA